MNKEYKLPALRSLGDLADVRPTIVIDSREQTPLTFTRLDSVVGTLQSGDYSFVGGDSFVIERKSIPDLVSCCVGSNRERFERELHRLRGFKFARLLIVGSRQDIEEHNYRSDVAPKSVLHSLSAFEARYGIAVVFEPCPEAAACLVESWAYWSAREVVGAANELLRSNKQLKEAANV